MSKRTVILLEVWFFIGLPVLGHILSSALGPAGGLLFMALFAIWCWELFAFAHYRYCRQEELVHVIQAAAATRAPVEAVLRAYREDRPSDELHQFWKLALLFFVFPGYYWTQLGQGFDAEVDLLLALLENGVPLDQALRAVPGTANRQVALAVAVGRLSGRQRQVLSHLPDRRVTPQWLELVPRLWYPLMILTVLVGVVVFLMLFIVPKFEKIFEDFHLRLPISTQTFTTTGRWVASHALATPVAGLLLLTVFNVLLFSSRVKWYFPVVGRFYRMHCRGQFLQTLGLMLQTGKPVPDILERVIDSRLLPSVVARRAEELALDLSQGEPLGPSLARRGLATAPMQALIGAAERAHNLPWALEELGDTLLRRSARLSHRLVMAAFPLAVFACACLIAFVAVAMFLPLVALMEGLRG
jgi:type IV pilus assembly protein PilC